MRQRRRQPGPRWSVSDSNTVLTIRMACLTKDSDKINPLAIKTLTGLTGQAIGYLLLWSTSTQESRSQRICLSISCYR